MHRSEAIDAASKANVDKFNAERNSRYWRSQFESAKSAFKAAYRALRNDDHNADEDCIARALELARQERERRRAARKEQEELVVGMGNTMISQEAGLVVDQLATYDTATCAAILSRVAVRRHCTDELLEEHGMQRAVRSHSVRVLA